MTLHSDSLEEFRRLVNRRAKHSPTQWERSRRLLEHQSFSSTLERLRARAQDHTLPAAVQERLRAALGPHARRVQDLPGEALKDLTGLPATKALRALCVYFDLVEHPASRWPVCVMPSEAIEGALRQTGNPFDVLLHSDVASILDLGAGDLSFASELTDRYLLPLQQQRRDLVVHCVDRLHPASALGGPLHPDKARLAKLKERLGPSFGYFGDQDMFDLSGLDEQGKLAPRYTLVTCWAPATPTFAYEPSRLSASTIADDLRRTRGAFRHTRVDGEAALEVQHGDRTLLFPPWKFDIVGPLALLALLAERGSLCILGAVDTQVFWELLAQLLHAVTYRPSETPFSHDNIPKIFGDVYRTLDRLPPNIPVSLEDIAPLRTDLPRRNSRSASGGTYSFRHIEVRRGPTFADAPASSTAHKFPSMIEETTPWCLALVPA